MSTARKTLEMVHRYLDELELALHDYMPLTGSVDVRHFQNDSEYSKSSTSSNRPSSRLAVVDTNRFPAGFNHVDIADYDKAADALRRNARINGASGITVIHEAHTRMLAYYDSVHALVKILEHCWPEKKVERVSISNFEKHESARRKNDECGRVGNYFLLNADLSTGMKSEDTNAVSSPYGIDKTDVGDSPTLVKCVSSTDRFMGWDIRSKAIHFAFLSPIIEHVSSMLNLEEGSLEASFAVSLECCVEKPDHREQLAVQIDELLRFTAKRFTRDDHDASDSGTISSRRNIFVKNDSGTYGLGVYPFSSGDELRKANSTVLDKLSYARHGQRARRYVLQEGIPTSLRDSEGRSMEVVLMCLAGRCYSYFVRVGAVKNSDIKSLNAPGSFFVQRGDFESNPKYAEAAELVREYWEKYELLGRIAMISMAREAAWYCLNKTMSMSMIEAFMPACSVHKRHLMHKKSRNNLPVDGNSTGTQPGTEEKGIKKSFEAGGRKSKLKKRCNSSKQKSCPAVSAPNLSCADQEMRKLVGCIMGRVSTQLDGIKGGRIARKRLATDLNSLRKSILVDMREGVLTLANAISALLEAEDEFCTEMGVENKVVQAEESAPDSTCTTVSIAGSSPSAVPDDSSSAVDSKDIVSNNWSIVNSWHGVINDTTSPSESSHSVNTLVNNKENTKAPAVGSKAKIGIDAKRVVGIETMSGKEIDSWLRGEIGALIQKGESKSEKAELSKRLQPIKKELLKKRFASELELRNEFNAKFNS